MKHPGDEFAMIFKILIVEVLLGMSPVGFFDGPRDKPALWNGSWASSRIATSSDLTGSTVILWNNARGDGVNNARFHRFTDDEAFSYSLRYLAGCTGIVIVSKEAVYLAHYWESISFNQDLETDPNNPDEPPKTRYKTQDNAFRYTVTRALRKGIRKNGVVEQDSLQAHAHEMDDDSLHGFLMIPQTGSSDVGIGPEDPYRKYWEMLKEEVGKILPRLDPIANPDRWHEYRCAPAQTEENIGDFRPLKHTARGRLSEDGSMEWE
ncbi:hypothetical protein CMUS01_04266 [Colletotrichum musicola]|uniref:Uncharacterized protein n=1 Tax=Colletotrichum musicola TaxID=2175873 RepID=A0A8H6NNH8_9PEZI|nr:hypothetical protein CMUS01_04266 [Colletotrichum musicola]